MTTLMTNAEVLERLEANEGAAILVVEKWERIVEHFQTSKEPLQQSRIAGFTCAWCIESKMESDCSACPLRRLLGRRCDASPVGSYLSGPWRQFFNNQCLETAQNMLKYCKDAANAVQ